MSRLRANVLADILETFNEVEYESNIGSLNTIQKLERQTLKNQTQRTPSWTQNLRKYIFEYCVTCGVHGFRYLGEGGRLLLEKLTWSAVVVTMSYLSIILILSAYNRWIASPVIVTFATTETPIGEIPFPAVTICPIVKSDPEIFNFTDVYLKLHFNRSVTGEELRYFESLLLVCNPPPLSGYVRSVTINESSIYDLYSVFPNNYYFTVHWLAREYKNALSGTFTVEGFCYTFNMLDMDDILFDNHDYVRNSSLKGGKAKKWSIENGYSNQNEMDTFPRRTSITGINGGLTVELLTHNSHLDYFCTGLFEGFKVTLHHPSELPDINQQIRVPLDKAVSVAIEPKMIIVSEEVKAYEPIKRGCFFANERPLMSFRSYSQRNCLDECLANYTAMVCRCVAFYMSKIHNIPICGPGKTRCLLYCQVTYLLPQIVKSGTKSPNVLNCNCLPSCTSLMYEGELSQSNLNTRAVFDAVSGIVELPSKYENKRISKLTVYFKETQFRASVRHELYGTVEFFANAGGLLGLFLGFSVTSAIEIIYFLTLRIVCNIRKYGRAKWAGEQDLEN